MREAVHERGEQLSHGRVTILSVVRLDTSQLGGLSLGRSARGGNLHATESSSTRPSGWTLARHHGW